MRKPRSVTRANKKLGKEQERALNIRNDAGYNDPTPYFAFKDMEREERKTKKQNTERNNRTNTTGRYTA